MISEKMNKKECKTKQTWPNLVQNNYTGIRLKGQGKTEGELPITAGTQIILTADFHYFCHFIQANAGICFKLDEGRFPPCLLQFIILYHPNI
jgi:hypothetical protein